MDEGNCARKELDLGELRGAFCLGGEAEVTCYHPYKELYQDAIFFRETALSQQDKDAALTRRYYRNALICFCAACEAMINNLLYVKLSQNGTSGKWSKLGKDLKDYFDSGTATYPDQYGRLRSRLYTCVGVVLTGNSIKKALLKSLRITWLWQT